MSKSCDCGTDKPVVARGMCKKCYDQWYNLNKSTMVRKQIRRKKPVKSDKVFPIAHFVTVWECSDGREFGTEVDALRYEIDLFRN